MFRTHFIKGNLAEKTLFRLYSTTLTRIKAQIAISSGSHPGQTRHHVFRATEARPGTTQPDLCLAEARSGVLNGPRSGINIWP